MKKVITFLLFFATACLFFFSCQKDPGASVTFTKYTQTDNVGHIIGPVDTTDWTNDTSWTTSEVALLNFSDPNITTLDTFPGDISVSPAFPDPSNGIYNLYVNTQRECIFKTVVVNTNFEILYYQERHLAGGPVGMRFDLSHLTAVHTGDYYRLYYGFVNAADSLCYKGHGDLAVQ